MLEQTSNNILMIRPAAFGFDAETAESNEFQHDIAEDSLVVQERAEKEFDTAAETLRVKGVNVFVFEDTVYPLKPDAVFPNNWVSFHEDGTVILYPMFAASRRPERRREIIDGLAPAFEIGEVVDLSGHENGDRFLEGTGSMVLDRANRVAYASLSPRTDERILNEVCERIGYKAVTFHSHGRSGREIYHTNVMMCVADDFVVICLEAITDASERGMVASSIRETGHEIIEITRAQMNNFAGNMLELATKAGTHVVALSRRGFEALTGDQTRAIERRGQLIPLDVPTIETAGGGSVRCMIAEIFLKPR